MPKVGSDIERHYINQALDTNYVNEGPLVAEFEKKIAALVGAEHAIAATSCTAGLFLGLKAVGVGPGDEVIVPDMTFIATANAVEMTGAKTVLVDVDPTTLTISVPAIKKALTPKTKAIVPVHVTGRAAAIEEIMALAHEHNLAVVEDAAEALGSMHQGKYLGTFGQVGCFSFSANKTITTGQGGMVVTNNPDLALSMRSFKDQGRPQRGTGGNDIHDTVGFNFKMTDLQAGLGLGQYTFFEERTTRMRRHYELYYQELHTIPEITFFPCALETGAVPQWTDIKIERRDELEQYLKDNNIDSRKYWYPIHSQKAYKLPDDNFPNSTAVSPKSLWLPSAFTLTDEDVMEVCRVIKEFFRV